MRMIQAEPIFKANVLRRRGPKLESSSANTRTNATALLKEVSRVTNTVNGNSLWVIFSTVPWLEHPTHDNHNFNPLAVIPWQFSHSKLP